MFAWPIASDSGVLYNPSMPEPFWGEPLGKHASYHASACRGICLGMPMHMPRHVDAYAYAQLATNETCNGKTLNLTGPCYTQSELVDSANKVYDIEVIYQPISFEDNIKRLRDIPLFATRGHNVINMLGGCFQCIEQNVFDVPSDYLAACGREPLPLYEQMKTFL